MRNLIFETINGRQIAKEEAVKFFDRQLLDLLYISDEIRKKHKDNKVKACSIINAKSRHCGENCKFCAQSS